MNSRDKIQHMLITHLLREGSIDLTLPDGIRLEVGVIKEGRDGFPEICDNYCWVNASRGTRETFIDSYVLEMKYSDSGQVVQDDLLTEEGEHVKYVEIV